MTTPVKSPPVLHRTQSTPSTSSTQSSRRLNGKPTGVGKPDGRAPTGRSGRSATILSPTQLAAAQTAARPRVNSDPADRHKDNGLGNGNNGDGNGHSPGSGHPHGAFSGAGADPRSNHVPQPAVASSAASGLPPAEKFAQIVKQAERAPDLAAKIDAICAAGAIYSVDIDGKLDQQTVVTEAMKSLNAPIEDVCLKDLGKVTPQQLGSLQTALKQLRAFDAFSDVKSEIERREQAARRAQPSAGGGADTAITNFSTSVRNTLAASRLDDCLRLLQKTADEFEKIGPGTNPLNAETRTQLAHKLAELRARARGNPDVLREIDKAAAKLGFRFDVRSGPPPHAERTREAAQKLFKELKTPAIPVAETVNRLQTYQTLLLWTPETTEDNYAEIFRDEFLKYVGTLNPKERQVMQMRLQAQMQLPAFDAVKKELRVAHQVLTEVISWKVFDATRLNIAQKSSEFLKVIAQADLNDPQLQRKLDWSAWNLSESIEPICKQLAFASTPQECERYDLEVWGTEYKAMDRVLQDMRAHRPDELDRLCHKLKALLASRFATAPGKEVLKQHLEGILSTSLRLSTRAGPLSVELARPSDPKIGNPHQQMHEAVGELLGELSAPSFSVDKFQAIEARVRAMSRPVLQANDGTTFDTLLGMHVEQHLNGMARTGQVFHLAAMCMNRSRLVSGHAVIQAAIDRRLEPLRSLPEYPAIVRDGMEEASKPPFNLPAAAATRYLSTAEGVTEDIKQLASPMGHTEFVGQLSNASKKLQQHDAIMRSGAAPAPQAGDNRIRDALDTLIGTLANVNWGSMTDVQLGTAQAALGRLRTVDRRVQGALDAVGATQAARAAQRAVMAPDAVTEAMTQLMDTVRDHARGTTVDMLTPFTEAIAQVLNTRPRGGAAPATPEQLREQLRQEYIGQLSPIIDSYAAALPTAELEVLRNTVMFKGDGDKFAPVANHLALIRDGLNRELIRRAATELMTTLATAEPSAESMRRATAMIREAMVPALRAAGPARNAQQARQRFEAIYVETLRPVMAVVAARLTEAEKAILRDPSQFRAQLFDSVRGYLPVIQDAVGPDPEANVARPAQVPARSLLSRVAGNFRSKKDPGDEFVKGVDALRAPKFRNTGELRNSGAYIDKVKSLLDLWDQEVANAEKEQRPPHYGGSMALNRLTSQVADLVKENAFGDVQGRDDTFKGVIERLRLTEDERAPVRSLSFAPARPAQSASVSGAGRAAPTTAGQFGRAGQAQERQLKELMTSVGPLGDVSQVETRFAPFKRQPSELLSLLAHAIEDGLDGGRYLYDTDDVAALMMKLPLGAVESLGRAQGSTEGEKNVALIASLAYQARRLSIVATELQVFGQPVALTSQRLLQAAIDLQAFERDAQELGQGGVPEQIATAAAEAKKTLEEKARRFLPEKIRSEVAQLMAPSASSGAPGRAPEILDPQFLRMAGLRNTRESIAFRASEIRHVKGDPVSQETMGQLIELASLFKTYQEIESQSDGLNARSGRELAAIGELRAGFIAKWSSISLDATREQRQSIEVSLRGTGVDQSRLTTLHAQFRQSVADMVGSLTTQRWPEMLAAIKQVRATGEAIHWLNPQAAQDATLVDAALSEMSADERQALNSFVNFTGIPLAEQIAAASQQIVPTAEVANEMAMFAGFMHMLRGCDALGGMNAANHGVAIGSVARNMLRELWSIEKGAGDSWLRTAGSAPEAVDERVVDHLADKDLLDVPMNQSGQVSAAMWHSLNLPNVRFTFRNAPLPKAREGANPQEAESARSDAVSVLARDLDPVLLQAMSSVANAEAMDALVVQFFGEGTPLLSNDGKPLTIVPDANQLEYEFNIEPNDTREATVHCKVRVKEGELQFAEGSDRKVGDVYRPKASAAFECSIKVSTRGAAPAAERVPQSLNYLYRLVPWPAGVTEPMTLEDIRNPENTGLLDAFKYFVTTNLISSNLEFQIAYDQWTKTQPRTLASTTLLMESVVDDLNAADKISLVQDEFKRLKEAAAPTGHLSETDFAQFDTAIAALLQESGKLMVTNDLPRFREAIVRGDYFVKRFV